MIFLCLEEEKWVQKKRKSHLHANETALYDLAYRDFFLVVKIYIWFMEILMSYSFLFYPNTVYALYKTLF